MYKQIIRLIDAKLETEKNGQKHRTDWENAIKEGKVRIRLQHHLRRRRNRKNKTLVVMIFRLFHRGLHPLVSPSTFKLQQACFLTTRIYVNAYICIIN